MLQNFYISPLVKQLWISFGMWIYQFTVGVAISYPSCLLPALREPGSNFDIDLYTTSVIGSSISYSNMVGFLMVAYSMERFGRKKSTLIIVVPGVVGWTVISLATDVATIVIGRILTGVTVAAVISLTSVIIAEYSSPEYRGLFINAKFSSAIFGSAILRVFQLFASWREIAVIAATLNALPVICLLKFPESPIWLAVNGKFEECERSFLWLRGSSDSSRKELDKLIEHYKTEIKTKEMMSFTNKATEFLQNLRRNEFYKPLTIICLGMMVFELSGRNYIVAYSSDIIDEISGNKTNSFYAIIGIDIILVTYGLTSPILVRFIKRRTLLFVVGFSALAVLAIFCTYLFLVSKGDIPKGSPWIPLSMFGVYFILSTYGCCTVPYILMGELLPVNKKDVSIVLLGVILSLAMQISLQIFPYLLAYIKVYGAFTVMGSNMLCILLILYFILPETKDKTLKEINNTFSCTKYECKSRDRDTEIINCNSDFVKVRF